MQVKCRLSGRPEAVEIFNTVLDFVRAVDPNHFKAMREAVNVNPDLPEAAATPSPGEEG